ncbi:MAG: ribosome small subunit-dependent GTPase A [Sutterella wadsworthensis]|nr:ribosome small subunit-dependent GTPase A [Sutterella wadsworthensis]
MASKKPTRKAGKFDRQVATGPLLTGRVTAGHGRHYFVTLEDGTVLEAHRRGKKGDVVVGDMVHCTAPVSGVSAIEGIEERRNLLYRSDEWRIKSLASNIDLVCIVFASRPTFNPWFIWKALLAAHQAGIPALVIRNKDELEEGAEDADIACMLLEHIGHDVISVSAQARPEETRARLIEKLSGRASLLVGQSGMGKSTILNLLVPHAQATTREFSEALNLGKQTTTAARWYSAADDDWQGAVIDTPGFQEFGLAHLSLNDILRAMPDIAEHVNGCRFFNCRHLEEPGCSVKAAVEDGYISEARYEFYRSLAIHADTLPL